MKRRTALIRAALLLILGTLAVSTFAQEGDTLTLEEAISMARERNGDIRAAIYDVQSATSRVRQAFSDFLPMITPSYSYVRDRSQVFTGSTAGVSDFNTRTASVTASWKLLDLGERDWGYRATRRLAEATGASSLSFIRSTLFLVQQRYYNATRGRELLKVADAEVQRTQTTLDATTLQIEVGAAPKKDALQAKADLLNAKVNQLEAQNFNATADADLKAIIGWEQEEPLPPLEKSETPKEFAQAPDLATTIKEGLANRPDLIALRKRVQAQEYNVRIADRNAMISLSVDALYSRNFSPLVEDQRRLTLLASIPLYDGGFLKEAARQQRIELNTQKVLLAQAERDAAAEIEAAWHVLNQNTLRVQAAAAALEASQLNYEAAAESQRLGAEGTSVITVLTARVSLVTAESNFVQALYDYYISVANLKLVTGQPLPGEPKMEDGYSADKKE